ncbi:MAG: hypothetical protein WBF58_21650 [Xanthobacteraceae bacterium]
MLQNLSAAVRECLEHAEDCARQAKVQGDPTLRQDFIDLEGRWLKLARSYEFTDRLESFFNSIRRPGY